MRKFNIYLARFVTEQDVDIARDATLDRDMYTLAADEVAVFHKKSAALEDMMTGVQQWWEDGRDEEDDEDLCISEYPGSVEPNETYYNCCDRGGNVRAVIWIKKVIVG